MKTWTRRDLTIIPTDGHNCLVVACDSCGGVGVKDGDVLKLPAHYAAKFTTRVALTEVLCSGAMPIAISNGVTGEMNPTGAEMILGVQDEIKQAGITGIAITGSTEENFTTSMTGISVTVIGTCRQDALKFANAARGDKFILFGVPRLGAEVDLDSPGFYRLINWLLPIQSVKEVVPVGSKGVAYEARHLASLSGREIALYNTEIDYYKSAGHSTCLLVLCEDAAVEQIRGYCPGLVVGEVT